MIDAVTYNDMLSHIQSSKLLEDTIGILFTRPDLTTGKEIIDGLEYYHHWTSRNINFYLPGYGAYWAKDKYPDMRPVTMINGVQWSYSNKAFVDFVNNLENESKWKYSGESELVIIPYASNVLDFSDVLVFKLDVMLRDKTIYSVSNFITSLSRNVRRNNEIGSIAHKGAVKCVAHNMIEEMVSKLPNTVSQSLVNGSHYLRRDFAK